MNHKTYAPIRGALVAGSAAATVTTIVSLPLRSPDDTLLNAGTVMAGVLGLAVLGGLFWRQISQARYAAPLFGVTLGVGFLIWTAFALAVDGYMERMFSFSVPLAAIACGTIAVLTPVLTYSELASRRWVVAAVVAFAAGTGVVLANIGDEGSGRLELPPRVVIETITGIVRPV